MYPFVFCFAHTISMQESISCGVSGLLSSWIRISVSIHWNSRRQETSSLKTVRSALHACTLYSLLDRFDRITPPTESCTTWKRNAHPFFWIDSYRDLANPPQEEYCVVLSLLNHSILQFSWINFFPFFSSKLLGNLVIIAKLLICYCLFLTGNLVIHTMFLLPMLYVFRDAEYESEVYLIPSL